MRRKFFSFFLSLVLVLGGVVTTAGAAEGDLTVLHLRCNGSTHSFDLPSDVVLYGFSLDYEATLTVNLDGVRLSGVVTDGKYLNRSIYHLSTPISLKSGSHNVSVSGLPSSVGSYYIFLHFSPVLGPTPTPTPTPTPKLTLTNSLPFYLVTNTIPLAFSHPLKSVSVNLTDAAGGTVATTTNISGQTATVTVTDPAFETGQPYTFTLSKATSVDGLELDKPITHSFQEAVSTGDATIDTILYSILSVFTESKSQGLLIVIIAIAVGLIFVLARWLWSMAKVWLKRSKH